MHGLIIFYFILSIPCLYICIFCQGITNCDIFESNCAHYSRGNVFIVLFIVFVFWPGYYYWQLTKLSTEFILLLLFIYMIIVVPVNVYVYNIQRGSWIPCFDSSAHCLCNFARVLLLRADKIFPLIKLCEYCHICKSNHSKVFHAFLRLY